MEKLTRREREAMEQLSQERFDSEALETKIINTLRSKGFIKDPTKERKMKTVIASIAASVALLFLGYFIGKQTSVTSTNLAMNQYALFLYENEEFTTTDVEALVSQYSQWAADLGQQGKLLYAEELSPDDSWLGSRTVQNQTSKLSGYFVFYAKDWAEAQVIAETHPHTGYGGGLELRPINKIE